MEFIIGVDCDGVACAVGEPGKSLSFSRDYDRARRQATREADAAARALYDAGADHVIVWDNHGGGMNLEYHRLDPRCEIALGAGFAHRWPGLRGHFAGVLMVGYHAMENAPGGVLAHTYSPRAYAHFAVNDQTVGEIALDAAVAGDRSVPVIFVSSDDKGCDEAERFLPWTERVCTKRGHAGHAAVSLSPERAAETVYAGVRRAVARLEGMQTFRFPPPIRMKVRYKSPLTALKTRLRGRGWRLAGLQTVRRTFDSLADWQC
ncbi:MAG: M55 family metallopeptidase [Planctomycetota bacterium]